jgi:hypothetical protein
MSASISFLFFFFLFGLFDGGGLCGGCWWIKGGDAIG